MAMRSSSPAPAPLFHWRETRAAEALEAERAALARHIETLKPHSHARVIAEARLRELTRQALILEIKPS